MSEIVEPSSSPTKLLKAMLVNRYSGEYLQGMRRYVFGDEVQNEGRWADFIVQDTWQGSVSLDLRESHGYPRHGFEIKVSRSDWLNELKDPFKAQAFIPYCHYWYLVIANESMVKKDELPDNWGLLVPRGENLYTITKAKRNKEVKPMPNPMMVSFMRRIDEVAREKRVFNAHVLLQDFVKNTIDEVPLFDGVK